MYAPVAFRRLTLVLVGLALVTAGCGGSGSSGRATASAPAGSPAATTHVAQPVRATPSVSARMVCSLESQQKVLADATGVRTTRPVVATWKHDVYSCPFFYGTAALVLSVKELANATQTDEYFASLERRLGVARLVPIRPRAFLARNGSVVVQKDYKVLLVDVANLPARFGEPLDSRGNIALNIATVIMGCWTGA